MLEHVANIMTLLIEGSCSPVNCCHRVCFWLVGCFGFNGLLRQSISGRLPERGRKRGEKVEESKNVQTTPGGGRVVRWVWVNFQCRGVLLIWIRVGRGPSVLAVGAGGGCLDVFSLIYHFSSLSLGDGPI